MVDRVARVKRRAGGLREIETDCGRRFLVVGDGDAGRFLETGRSLGRCDIEELSGALARKAGIARALRLLTVRDRSEREITSLLTEEGIESPAVLDDIVDTLKRSGYLNDRRLASAIVSFLVERRPSGRRLIVRRLRDAGIDDEIIEPLVAASLDQEYERRAAGRLAGERFDTGIDRKRAVRRIHGLLTRRGFEGAVVGDICARLLRGETVGDPDER